MATQGDIVAAVISNTRRRDKQAEIEMGINLAHQELSLRHDFRSMRGTQELSITAGARSTQLPSNCDQLIICRFHVPSDLTQWWPCELRDKRYVEANAPNEMQGWSGRPVICYQAGTELFWMPRGSQDLVLTLDFYSWFGDLASTDSPHKSVVAAIEAWTTAYIFRKTQQFEDASFWMQEYERQFLLAKRADMRKGTVVQMQPFNNRSALVAVPPYLDPFARR